MGIGEFREAPKSLLVRNIQTVFIVTPEARRKLIEAPISINYIGRGLNAGGCKVFTKGYSPTPYQLTAKPIFREGYSVRPHQHRFQNDSGALTVGRAAFSED